MVCANCDLVFGMPTTQPLINDVPDARDNGIGTEVFLHGSMSLRIRVSGYPTPIKVSFGNLRVLTIGRAMPDNHVEIDLNDYGARAAGVSRNHAILSYMNDTLYIADVGSANGTYVNGVKLENGKATALRSFDVINLGLLEFKVYYS